MHLKKTFAIIVWALPIFTAEQKNITITGNIRNLHNEKVFFRYYTGSKATYSDSLVTQDGKIQFSVPDSLRGLSAIRIHNRPDFIIRLITNGSDIVFNADAYSPADSIDIVSSKENKQFYYYLHHSNDPALQKDSSLPAAFLKLLLPVSVPKGVNADQWTREHFLDRINLNNPAIIHTDFFRPQINEYLGLFNDGSIAGFDEFVDSFSVAIDKLLHRATNETVYNYLVEDLNNRYRYGNYDIIGAYITQYYTSRFVLDKNYPVSEIAQRISKLKHPTLGQRAPEIIMNIPRGPAKMSEIKAAHLLLVFWSTGCPHCKISVPLLKKIYDARKGDFEILAVSFDTEEPAWKKFIQDHGLTWINFSDLKGFESKIALDYDIQGTPTFILLDQNKTIISKPEELKDIENELRRLKIL